MAKELNICLVAPRLFYLRSLSRVQTYGSMNIYNSRDKFYPRKLQIEFSLIIFRRKENYIFDTINEKLKIKNKRIFVKKIPVL